MTREEAWKKLKGYLYDVLTGEEADEIIKALEEPCDNAISKEAVLEIFGYVMDCWKEHAIDVEPHEIKDALIEQYEFTAKQLNELPPVTPTEPKLGKIRDEIRFMQEIQLKGEDESEWNKCIKEVLEIIDKYRESEK